jgi:serine/threonine protein kinase
VWALGVVTFECLTGRSPFKHGPGTNLISAICSGPIAKPSDVARVPVGLDDWFEACLAREVSRRTSSARELALDFALLMERTSGYLPLRNDSEWRSVPTVVAYPSTEDSQARPRVSSSIPAAINDQRDENHIALIAKINRESAVIWTRRRCVKGQQMKLTLHFEAQDAGYSTLARVLRVAKHPPKAPSMWHYGVTVRFEAPLDGLDAELAKLGLS